MARIRCRVCHSQTCARRSFLADRALKLARAARDDVRVAGILGTLGDYFLQIGDQELSERHLLSARELAEQTGDKVLLGRLQNNLGVTYIYMERFEEALECYRAALELRQGIEYRRGIIVNLHNIGDVYFRMGDDGRAYQYFRESLAVALEYNWDVGQVMNTIYIAYLDCGMEPDEEDLRVLEESVDRALMLGAGDVAAQGKVFLARLSDRVGETSRARRLLDEAGELGDVVLAGLDS